MAVAGPSDVSGKAAQIVKLAKSQVGTLEGKKNGVWDNDQKYSRQVPGLSWSNFQPWCMTFGVWLYWKVGLIKKQLVTASCAASAAYWRKKHRLSKYPMIGGGVYYGYTSPEHYGTVVAYDATTHTAVEGNTTTPGVKGGSEVNGSGVALKRRSRTEWVIGYSEPALPGAVSANPRFKPKKKPKPKPGKKATEPPVKKPSSPSKTPFVDDVLAGKYGTPAVELTAAVRAKVAATGADPKTVEENLNKKVMGA